MWAQSYQASFIYQTIDICFCIFSRVNVSSTFAFNFFAVSLAWSLHVKICRDSYIIRFSSSVYVCFDVTWSILIKSLLVLRTCIFSNLLITLGRNSMIMETTLKIFVWRHYERIDISDLPQNVDDNRRGNVFIGYIFMANFIFVSSQVHFALFNTKRR